MFMFANIEWQCKFQLSSSPLPYNKFSSIELCKATIDLFSLVCKDFCSCRPLSLPSALRVLSVSMKWNAVPVFGLCAHLRLYRHPSLCPVVHLLLSEFFINPNQETRYKPIPLILWSQLVELGSYFCGIQGTSLLWLIALCCEVCLALTSSLISIQ